MGQFAGKSQVLVVSAALLILACGRSETAAEGNAEATAVAELPLKRGFYVTSDTACAGASNATLLLVRRDGFNGARDACDFGAIEQTGPTRYRVSAQCADIQAPPGSAEAQLVSWEIPDDASFTLTNETGPARGFRHCEQSSLPEPWRDNDISDLIGQSGGQ